jgi:DNA mismatch endonuclease, patch repair protein
MADVFTKAQRSLVMARIRSSGNISTEMKAVQLFRRAKIKGWRRRLPVFGNPDFVFPKSRIAVFIDGCFWHGCPKCKRVPTSSVKFWKDKIQRNIRRDQRVSRELAASGWGVVRVRECQLKSPRRFLSRIKRLLLV